MHDEIQDIYEAIFDRIILGLTLISLMTALIALFTGGIASPWFIRAVALLLVAIVAFGLRLFGKFMAAAYLLVLELLGLVVEMLLRPGAFNSFVPYLLIPIAIISGLLFSPLVTLIITVSAIGVVLLLMALTGQFNGSNLGILFPALLFTLFNALLSSEYQQRMLKLGHLLRENRILLRDRTRKIMESTRIHELNQHQLVELQRQLAQVKMELAQARRRLGEGDERFYYLLRGTVQQSEQALKQLEQALDQTGDQQPAISFEPLWRQIDYLKSLLINLQELVQVEHGELSLSYQAIDVKQLLHELAGTARGLVRHKLVEIRVHTAENLPVLQADLLRVRQALLQLLHNAITYTEQGLIELQAEVVNDEFRIFISDTGAGIAREALSQVFEIFGRGNHRQVQGAGLGLALTRRLIELHGGRVWASSILGVGSTFYLALPLKPEPAPVAPELTLSFPAAAGPASVPALPGNSDRLAPQTALPLDPDETMISSRFIPVATGSIAAQPARSGSAQSEPIRRFGQIYVRRLSLITLALLVVILGLVAVLAIVNGPNEQQVRLETPTLPASPTAAALVLPSPTPRPTILAATATASPTSRPTNTPLPPAPSPTAAATPTEEPTPSPTATASPTPLAISPLLPATMASVNGRPLAFGTHPVDLLAGSSSAPIKTANNSRLSWSRTGQALLTGEAANDREIYRLDPRNDQPLNLTAAAGDDLQPAWSPDGRQVAFSSGRSGNFDIYLMQADGSSLVALTDSRGYDEWPAWSPDGRQIAFISDRDGNAEIYLIQAGGGNLRRLTNHPADDWPAAWSPDGQRLVFASNRDENWNLYLVSVEGGPALRLTGAPGDEREPVWSPDGQMIAFAYHDGQNWDIYAIPAPVGVVTETPPDLWLRITRTPADERYPVWLPDTYTVAP